MKLSELLFERTYNNSIKCFATFETHGFDEFEVEIEYTSDGGSHSDHPYGEGSAREYHGAEIEIKNIALSKDVEQYDDEMEKVVKVWSKGTNIEELPGWNIAKDSNMKYFYEKCE